MSDNFEVSNPDKIIFKKDKIKKIEVIEYYISVGELMLPFIENRPLSVIRCHDGIDGDCFFKKHPTTEKEMVEICKIDKHEYFYISKLSQLIYQVQMGTVEFHPWCCEVGKINKPNLMIFDLDPAENVNISKLRKAVLCLKEILDELNVKSFLKTSGGKGYHIFVPFTSTKSWKSFSSFANNVALLLENKHPDMFTSKLRKSERNGKIFVDWLRNKKGASCVAPYSLRARDGAGISMPIEWKDLNKIAPNEITIKNYKKYINKNAWKNFFELEQELK